MMWDVFNAITLAIWVYVLIPFWVVFLFGWIKNKLQSRRDRKRVAELFEAEKAEFDRLRVSE